MITRDMTDISFSLTIKKDSHLDLRSFSVKAATSFSFGFDSHDAKKAT